ncbi:MAG: OmpA family protein [Acidaminococcaceae bacterium]
MAVPKPVVVAPVEKDWVIYFDFDDDAIRPQDTAVLDDVVMTFKTNPQATIALVGHTDSIGTDDYNMDLSWRRVWAAQNYLLERGIPDSTITVAANGESTPATSNETEDGRSLNRRVTIHLRKP